MPPDFIFYKKFEKLAELPEMENKNCFLIELSYHIFIRDTSVFSFLGKAQFSFFSHRLLLNPFEVRLLENIS